MSHEWSSRRLRGFGERPHSRSLPTEESEQKMVAEDSHKEEVCKDSLHATGVSSLDMSASLEDLNGQKGLGAKVIERKAFSGLQLGDLPPMEAWTPANRE